MAKGLARRLLGATLAGAGAGIVQKAAHQREMTLAAMRESRADARMARSEALTREGWDRQDARASQDAAAAAALARVEREQELTDAETAREHDRARWDAQDARADKRLEEQRLRDEGRLIVTGEDFETGARTYDTQGNVRRQMQADKQAQADADAAAALADAEAALTTEAEEAFDSLGPAWNESIDWINPLVDSDAKAAGASEEEFVARYKEAKRRNPDMPKEQLARRVADEFRGQGGGQDGGSAMASERADGLYRGNTAPQGIPNAVKQPDGTWQAPDENGVMRVILE